MEQIVYFEDYEIGFSRTTLGRTITETDFVVHAGHTGDFFPHHMDAEYMKGTPFGQRIAHGTLVFSIGIGLTASVGWSKVKTSSNGPEATRSLPACVDRNSSRNMWSQLLNVPCTNSRMRLPFALTLGAGTGDRLPPFQRRKP